jgi:hypothetical protein
MCRRPAPRDAALWSRSAASPPEPPSGLALLTDQA